MRSIQSAERDSPEEEELARIEARRRDLDLAREVLAGSPEAVDRFAHRMECVPRILGALNRRMGMCLTAEDLADLSQDVLLLIWSKLEDFAGLATLESWAHRFCFLELRNRVRRKVRLNREAQELQDEESISSPESGPQDYDFLLRSLGTLGSPAVDIVRLKVYERMTFSQIGARLEMSTNTAKTHYYRGLSRLRGKLEPHYGGDD